MTLYAFKSNEVACGRTFHIHELAHGYHGDCGGDVAVVGKHADVAVLPIERHFRRLRDRNPRVPGERL
ncbi:hypothetical protein DPMN_147098 [Dreissena polymorpha]|uniref:Uncharacterized protein n=1 Tax=Dreissena polymorpha TaxID=45954 RepID=A0A9D4F743_DREPO|nr:hypothetical protein DPMN_147098 [Dreissena polymorpha]